jgi:5-bromo-4-chloroindolyl phosphate hydrolysis protein
MKSDNYIDFGEEIGRTIKRVLDNRDFRDLKESIDSAMRDVSEIKDRTMRDVSEMRDSLFYPNSRSDGRTASRSESADSSRPPKAESKAAYAQPGARNDAARRRKHKGASMVSGTLFLILGSVCAAVFGIAALVEIIMENTFLAVPAMEVAGRVFGALFLASSVPIFYGIGFRKRARRFRSYVKVLNGRTYCMIEELAAACGREAKFIVKDLRRMIRAELFEEGYLDEQETCLMTDYPTYNQYLDTMKSARLQQEEEERKWANRDGGDALRDTVAEGQNYIRAIKAANDALPEADISEKLDRLEQVTSKIFDYVEQHPAKLPEIRKFMSYYMPITLKLVNAYQRFGLHDFSTSEAEDAKLEIRGTLDTINRAYENLLKRLMQADILDVSSDISTLETILTQEGLTGDDFAAEPTRLN